MLLRSHGLMEDVRFRYLAAKCLAAVDEWDECLTLVGDGGLDEDMQEVSRTEWVDRHSCQLQLRCWRIAMQTAAGRQC